MAARRGGRSPQVLARDSRAKPGKNASPRCGDPSAPSAPCPRPCEGRRRPGVTSGAGRCQAAGGAPEAAPLRALTPRCRSPQRPRRPGAPSPPPPPQVRGSRGRSARPAGSGQRRAPSLSPSPPPPRQLVGASGARSVRLGRPRPVPRRGPGRRRRLRGGARAGGCRSGARGGAAGRVGSADGPAPFAGCSVALEPARG